MDLSTTLMGPFCSLQMAHLGADVIKLEAPGGDIVRNIADVSGHGLGPAFLNANHGKRSISLDLRVAEGHAALLRIVAQADVVMHNMRPRAVSRLKITHDDIRKVNPTCIYASMVGFGSHGPYRDHAAYDDVIQAISGVAAVQGASAQPEYVRTTIADKTVGLVALSTILAALIERVRTGTGQAIEIPMFETMAAYMLLEQQGGFVTDPPQGPSGYARTASPYRRPYATADGYISVMVYTDRQWADFFALVGQPGLIADPKFSDIGARTANIDQLYHFVEQELRRDGTAHWLSELGRLGIASVPVLTIADLFEDPHLEAVDFFSRSDHPILGNVRYPRFPASFSSGTLEQIAVAPLLGEHTVEILEESGFSSNEIRELLASSVAFASPLPGSGV